MSGHLKVLMGIMVVGLTCARVAQAEREGSGSQEEMHEHGGTQDVREGSGVQPMREGSGTQAAPPFRDGQRVALTGRVVNKWLTVTEGPQTDQRFELADNDVFHALKREGFAAATYAVTGYAVDAGDHNLIVLETFQRPTPNAMAPMAPLREGS